MTDVTGPARPATLEFLKIRDPDKPTTLLWKDPGPGCRALIVYATQNPFPPNMAGQLFAGKMKQFIDEDKLEPGKKQLKIARAERFYAVVWIDDDDGYHAVEDLREPSSAGEVLVDIQAQTATQARTYLRARYRPGIVEFRDEIPKSPLGKVLRKYLV